MFTKESNYNPRFFSGGGGGGGGGISSSVRIFDNYKEKLSVPRAQTAALTEF